MEKLIEIFPQQKLQSNEIEPANTELNNNSLHADIITGIHKAVIEWMIWINLSYRVFKRLYNPYKVFGALREFEKLRRSYMGDYRMLKFVKVDGRYYWNIYGPGFPSLALNKYHEGELNRLYPVRQAPDYLKTILFGITNKCPMRCEHCFEWERLNKKEDLSLDDLKIIVKKFQDRGVSQIQLSGGEPLNRVNDIIELLKSAKHGTDFWISTSGYKLTLENALRLKKAGLVGVAISLDHFEPHLHNQFRGFDKAYEWAIKSVQNAHQARLVVNLRLCATKTFISENNLMKYASMAKKLGAAFIEVLDPRAVGRYGGKDVEITEIEERILDDFYIKINYNPEFKDMPIVAYSGYHQRRVGCFGAGNRYLYVDTNGDIHACPFCQNVAGNALSSSIDESINTLKSKGCYKY